MFYILAGIIGCLGALAGIYQAYDRYKEKKKIVKAQAKIIHLDLDAVEKFGATNYKDNKSIKREYFSGLGADDIFIYSFHRLVTSYEEYNNNHGYIHCKQLSPKEISFDDIFIDVKNLSNEYFEQKFRSQKYSVYKGKAELINPSNGNPWIKMIAEKITGQDNICFYISRDDLIKDSKLKALKDLVNSSDSKTFYVYALGQIKKSSTANNYYIQLYNKNLRFVSIPEIFNR